MQHSIAGNHRLRARRPERTPLRERLPSRGSVFTYAAVAIIGTACFFFLHHLGNRIPYDLAKQRIAEEFASKRQDEGDVLRLTGTYEYCQISTSVMAGARKTDDNGSLVEGAIIQKYFVFQGRGYCDVLENAARGGEPLIGRIKPRYWWGSKALYAIALRHLSVYEYRQLIRTASYLAWGLLAFSLLLISPRTLAVVAPVILFGVFFSGIGFWSNVANGTPYAWAVSSAAILAFLISRRASRWGSPGAARLFCFIIGMVSSYLWLGDGHTFLSITLIGLVAWFGGDHSKASERVQLAASCIVLYLAGFAICYALGQLVKFIFLGSDVWWNFWNRAIVILDRTVSEDGVLSTGDMLRHFRQMAGWSIHHPVDESLTWFSAFALAGSLSFAAILACRARFDLLWNVLWIVCLLLINWPNFLVTEDIPWRTPRFMFVPHALGLSCLILALMKMNRRYSLIGVLLAGGIYFWLFRFSPVSNAYYREIHALIETIRPAVRSHFDVYLHKKQLVYVNRQCDDDTDTSPLFFVHVTPVDDSDLTVWQRRHGVEYLDFAFDDFGRGPGNTCIAVRDLPEYDIARVRTGQYVPGAPRLWDVEIRLDVDAEWIAGVVERAEPVIRAGGFDVYHDGNRLLYTGAECGEEDLAPPFFLHVFPEDEGDLPAAHREHGFHNLDFRFETHRLPLDFHFKDAPAPGGVKCIALVDLPGYEVVRIRTGQYVPGGPRLWEGEFEKGGA